MSSNNNSKIQPHPAASSLSDRFKHAARVHDRNKPDFRELDLLASPVSPLHAPLPTSSSSSSDSVPGRPGSNLSGSRGPADSSAYSGEFSSDTSPNLNPANKSSTTTTTGSVRSGQSHARSNFKSAAAAAHVRSDSSQCGVGSVNSPPPVSVLPAGNICPSGKYKTGMNTKPGIGRRDVLGTGSGHYGHGSIMRGTGTVSVGSKSDGNLRGGDYGVRKGMEGGDPEEVKRIGNEMYKRGNLVDALRLYDRAIALSPGNVSYRSNRAAALSGLGRLGEAVRECEEAVKLDPGYFRAHQRLGSLFIR